MTLFTGLAVDDICKLQRVYGVVDHLLYVVHDYPPETLHHYWGECNGKIVILAGHCVFLWARHSGV